MSVSFLLSRTKWKQDFCHITDKKSKTGMNIFCKTEKKDSLKVSKNLSLQSKYKETLHHLNTNPNQSSSKTSSHQIFNPSSFNSKSWYCAPERWAISYAVSPAAFRMLTSISGWSKSISKISLLSMVKAAKCKGVCFPFVVALMLAFFEIKCLHIVTLSMKWTVNLLRVMAFYPLLFKFFFKEVDCIWKTFTRDIIFLCMLL